MEPKILRTEITKSKKDNIYCLFLELNSKVYGIGHSDYNVEYNDDETKNHTLDLYIDTNESENIIGTLTIDVSEIWNKYEYPHYDIRKNKEEIYIYFYEYPYEEDEIEVLNTSIIMSYTKRT